MLLDEADTSELEDETEALESEDKLLLRVELLKVELLKVEELRVELLRVLDELRVELLRVLELRVELLDGDDRLDSLDELDPDWEDRLMLLSELELLLLLWVWVDVLELDDELVLSVLELVEPLELLIDE